MRVEIGQCDSTTDGGLECACCLMPCGSLHEVDCYYMDPGLYEPQGDDSDENEDYRDHDTRDEDTFGPLDHEEPVPDLTWATRSKYFGQNDHLTCWSCNQWVLLHKSLAGEPCPNCGRKLMSDIPF